MTATFQGGHPTAEELAGLLDGDGGNAFGRGRAVADHVDNCDSCLALLLTTAEAPIEPSDQDQRNFVAATIPGEARTALQWAHRPPTARSQLWRLTWDGLVALAVVIEGGAVTATVVPAADAADADDASDIVPSAQSPLGAALAIWPSCPAEVSLAAFDTCLGEISIPEPTSSDVGSSEEVATVRHLAEASLEWIPNAGEDSDSAQLSIADVLTERGIGYDDLADVVGDEAALELWRDGRPPRGNEIAALSGAFGIPATALAIGGVAPKPLLALASSTEFKDRVRSAATTRRKGETDIRSEMVSAALGLARAARTTSSSSSDDIARWRALIDHELSR